MSWQELLAREVAASSKAATARILGISRTSVSLLLAGKYPGATSRMARRINTLLAPDRSFECPYSGTETTIAVCAKNSAHVPTSSPAALRQWLACKDCVHAPHNKERNNDCGKDQ